MPIQQCCCYSKGLAIAKGTCSGDACQEAIESVTAMYHIWQGITSNFIMQPRKWLQRDHLGGDATQIPSNKPQGKLIYKTFFQVSTCLFSGKLCNLSGFTHFSNRTE